MNYLITVLDSFGFECVYHDEFICIYELLGSSCTSSIMRFYLYSDFYDVKSWLDGTLVYQLSCVSYNGGV